MQDDNFFNRYVLSETMGSQVRKWLTVSSIANLGLIVLYTFLYLHNANQGNALNPNIPFPFYFLSFAPIGSGLFYDMTKEHLRRNGIGLGLGGYTYDEQHDWFLTQCIKMFLIMTIVDTFAQFFGRHVWNAFIEFLYSEAAHLFGLQ